MCVAPATRLAGGRLSGSLLCNIDPEARRVPGLEHAWVVNAELMDTVKGVRIPCRVRGGCNACENRQGDQGG
jgi:hypothetical protein